MAAHNPNLRRWRTRGLLWLALVVLAPARGQGPAPAAPEYYRDFKALRIPFRDTADPRVVKVLLNASDDFGRTWTHVATANPNDHGFSYTVPRDGWYWFCTQTQEANGQLTPADSRQFQPQVKICVDTLKPVVALRQVAPREGAVAVEWDVQDENLDLSTLQIEYRPRGAVDNRDALPLRIPLVARGEQGFTPPANIPIEVHLTVRDKAKNQAETTIVVTPGAAVPGAGAPAAGNVPVKHVRKRDFVLGCKLTNTGDSGVKGIDVYVLRNNVWDKKTPTAEECKIQPEKAYCSITVASAGRWGFTLVPRSGVGLANPPPRPGDAPQIWIEVDETVPVVSIKDVVVGKGSDDLGRLTVYWSASDIHMRPKPITLSYAAKADGPWTPLASGLDNTGIYSLETRPLATPLPFQFFLKVEAQDEAGNVGSAVTRETVKIDTKIPMPTDVDVEPDRAASPADFGRPPG